MSPPAAFPIEGGCACRVVRYRLESEPLFVHCCHCRWCQRESGASFALNALIEADRVVTLADEPEVVLTPSHSGKGQKIARCPKCRVAVWSHYAGAGDAIRFVRVGTLDEPGRLAPDIHIYASSKQPWVVLPAGAPVLPGFYRWQEYWPPHSQQRLRVLTAPRTTAAEIVVARTDADYAAARALFEEYAAQLGIDLCFQGFDAELVALHEMYGPPTGRLLLARQGGGFVGCVGVRALSGGACEMKRLYARDGARGQGLGRALAIAAITAAREIGYERMLLDTLGSMTAARALYASLGFRETAPYYANPIADAKYLELDLRGTP